MKVLITGGSGYIGTHTTLKLLESGHHVTVIDLKPPHESVLPSVNYIQNDVAKNLDSRELFGVDVVIHLASHKSVNDSNQYQAAYYWNNVNSLNNVVRAMTVADVNNLIFASSCSVYGDWHKQVNEQVIVTESKSVYAHTKYICEQILKNIPINVLCFRYFNPIGTKVKIESGNALEYMVKASKNNTEFCVYGTDYDTIDGTCVRDYVHIDDLAQANVLACENMPAGFNAINIGSGVGTSVFQLVEKFVEQYPLTIGESKPRQLGNIAQIYADITKVKELLNWGPKLSLQQAIKDAYENG